MTRADEIETQYNFDLDRFMQEQYTKKSQEQKKFKRARTMILYIQDENYHFDGYVSGVIVDNNKVALFEKSGVTEHDITIPNELNWYELDSIKEDGNNVEIKAKNYSIYRKFFCLNKIEIEE